MHQAGEGVAVTLAGPLHEVSIHVDPSVVAPGDAIWMV
jgi:DNA-binding protein YbaB